MFALTTLGLITAAGPAMASAPAPIPLTSSKCPSDITEGEINGCVTELQTLLNKNGAKLTVDGRLRFRHPRRGQELPELART